MQLALKLLDGLLLSNFAPVPNIWRKMNRSKNVSFYRSVSLAILFCLSVLAIVLGKPILAPLALSFLLAFVLNPIVRYLESKRIPRLPSVLITSAVVLIVFLVFSTAFLTQFRQLASELPTHAKEVGDKIERLRQGAGTYIGSAWSMVDEIAARFQPEESEATISDRPVVVAAQDSSRPYLSMLPSFLGSLFQPIANTLIVIVLTVFMLISREDLRNRFLAILGQSRLSETTRILNDTSLRLSRYLLGLLTVNAGFAITFMAGLFLIGVPYAAVWGCLTFFLRFIPLLGSSISMLLPLALSIAVLPGWYAPIAVLSIYLALEGLTGNVIEPLAFGKSVGMNPLAVIVALMFWTWAWGPLGLALSTPMSLMIVTLGRHLPCFSMLDFLLGDTRPLPVHIIFFQRILSKDRAEAVKLYASVESNLGTTYAFQKVIMNSISYADRELRLRSITDETHREVMTSIMEIVDSYPVAVAPSSKAVEADVDLTLEPRSNALPKIIAFCSDEIRSKFAIGILQKRWPNFAWSVCENPSRFALKECLDEDVRLVIFSATPPHKSAQIEAVITRLRRSGYSDWIAVGNWRAKTLSQSIRHQLKQAGADYVTHRLHAMDRMIPHIQAQTRDIIEIVEAPPRPIAFHEKDTIGLVTSS
jgi:predicted PurR-regulated permease PerM